MYTLRDMLSYFPLQILIIRQTCNDLCLYGERIISLLLLMTVVFTVLSPLSLHQGLHSDLLPHCTLCIFTYCTCTSFVLHSYICPVLPLFPILPIFFLRPHNCNPHLQTYLLLYHHAIRTVFMPCAADNVPFAHHCHAPYLIISLHFNAVKHFWLDVNCMLDLFCVLYLMTS